MLRLLAGLLTIGRNCYCPCIRNHKFTIVKENNRWLHRLSKRDGNLSHLFQTSLFLPRPPQGQVFRQSHSSAHYQLVLLHRPLTILSSRWSQQTASTLSQSPHPRLSSARALTIPPTQDLTRRWPREQVSLSAACIKSLHSTNYH